MVEVVFPQHLNHHGNLFGGQALRTGSRLEQLSLKAAALTGYIEHPKNALLLIPQAMARIHHDRHLLLGVGIQVQVHLLHHAVAQHHGPDMGLQKDAAGARHQRIDIPPGPTGGVAPNQRQQIKIRLFNMTGCIRHQHRAGQQV